MKFRNYQLNKPFHFLLMLCCVALFSSCGGEDTINYREKIIGEWELKNVGDLEAKFRNKPFLLKGASMVFDDDGTIKTSMMSSKDTKIWLTDTGTWSMPTTGEFLTIKADNSPFDDALIIEFTDERTFWITLNELQYQFVKI